MTVNSSQHEVPVLIVAAPSGVGKTSLIKQMTTKDPSIAVVVSHTTRPPRKSETNGLHYHFVNHETFDTLRANDAFVETAEVFDYRYGVSWQALQAAQGSGTLVILEIDWQGARAVRKRGILNKSVFILPPTIQSQVDRLRGRAQDSTQSIKRRLQQAHGDCQRYKEFDYLIINDDFNQALDQLTLICDALRNNQTIDLPDVSSEADALIYALEQSVYYSR